MKFLRENFSLALGFSIPVLMILFVAASVYVPRFFYYPAYDFLYTVDDTNYTGQEYSIVDGKLYRSVILPAEGTAYHEPRVYLYHIKTGESEELSFAEAQFRNLRIDDSAESPDGFTFTQGGRGGDFFFLFGGQRDYDARYLVGHGTSVEVNLKGNNHFGYYNPRFLGWVIP